MIVLRIVSAAVSLLLPLVMPAVAYPFARVLHQGRQAIDDMISWGGANARAKETVEDVCTHAAVFLISGCVFVILGAIHLWYFNQFTLANNPWLYRIIGNLPLVGFNAVGFYNIAPLMYWTAAYVPVFTAGWFHWLRKRR